MDANYFILYWVLPYIDMNQPWVYMCPPSWTPLPPPSPSHPSGSSQCTSTEHPVSYIEPGLVIYFTYDNIHVSMLFSQIIPPLCRQVLYQLSHKGSPRILEWVGYPFSNEYSQPRNRTRVSCIADRFFFFFSYQLWLWFINSEKCTWLMSGVFVFFSFISIGWRLITPQYCSDSHHTLTWISHGFTCIPHPSPPSHHPLYLIPLGLPSAPGPSTCLMHPTWAGDLFHPR